MSRCPYCGGDTFEAHAAAEKAPTAPGRADGVWMNKCVGCHRFSLYNEATDEQIALDADRRVNGNGRDSNS